jgi:hypothetical protein
MAFSEAVAALGLHTPWDDLITAMGGDASSIALIKGVIATESGWNPSAVNPADPSYGLMQILAGPRGPYPSVLISDLMDPSTNITLGATYLQNQIARFSFPGGVAAYNSGSPRTLPGGQYVNQAYVDSVLSYQSYYLNAMMGNVNYGTAPDASLTVTGVYDPPTVDEPFVDPTVAESPGGSIFSSPTFDIGALIALGIIGVGIVVVSQK